MLPCIICREMSCCFNDIEYHLIKDKRCLPVVSFLTPAICCFYPVSTRRRTLKSEELDKHVFSTYVNLRFGIGALAIMFPVMLWLGGLHHGISLQGTMSAYYHQTVDGHSMRDLFVGVLFAIGVFLYLYKGFSSGENIALNFAGLCALGVALFPMDWPEDTTRKFTLHGFFAVSLFLCIAYVCVFHASDTLVHLKNKDQEKRYRRKYKILAVAMVLAPAIAWVLTVVFQKSDSWTYTTEAIGIVAFASYWLIKGQELSKTNVMLEALNGVLET